MRPPEQVTAELNQLINDDLETELYFTMALAICDLETGHVRLVQAGHPHPMILRRSGVAKRVGCGGLPVGLIDGASYDVVDFDLGPGDPLILYSDGFVEQEDREGAMLEEDGVAALLRDTAGIGAQDAVEAMMCGLAAHSGSTEFNDDVSCAVLDFLGVATPASESD